MHTTIKISAGSGLVSPLGGSSKPYCDVKVETDGEPADVRAVTEVAEAAIDGVCAALGIPRPEGSTPAVPDRARRMHLAIDEALPILRTLVGDLRDAKMKTAADALEGQTSAFAASRVETDPAR